MLPSSFSLSLFAVAACLAVVGQLLVLRDGLAGRTPAASPSSSGRAREALWIVLPALALALILAATWRALPAHRKSVIPASAPVAPAGARPAARLAPAAG